MTYCKKCGEKVTEEDLYCPECGKKVQQPKRQKTKHHEEKKTKEPPHSISKHEKQYNLPAIMTITVIFFLAATIFTITLVYNNFKTEQEKMARLMEIRLQADNEPKTTSQQPPSNKENALTKQQPQELTLKIANAEVEGKNTHTGQTRYRVQSLTFILTTPYELRDLQAEVTILNSRGQNPLPGHQYVTVNIPHVPPNEMYRREIMVNSPLLPDIATGDPLTIQLELKTSTGQTITTAQITEHAY